MIAEWDRWYYLIYLLPLGLAVVTLIATALMGGGDGDGDADAADFDADAGDFQGDLDSLTDGVDFSADADADLDADLDGDASAGHDGDVGGHHGASAGAQALAFFGFGRAPLTLLLQGFMLTWGAAGIYATQAFSQRWPEPAKFAPAAMLVAGFFGLMGMKLLGAFGSRYMKSVETYVVGKDDLIGEIGTVTYPVSETSGRVHVYDRHGTLHIESCRTVPGAEPLPRNTKVILVRHDTERRHYQVERSPV